MFGSMNAFIANVAAVNASSAGTTAVNVPDNK
jgi:hypothetical protein